MEKQEIKKALLEAMKEYTPADIHKHTGIPRETLSRFKNNKEVGLELGNMIKLAKYMKMEILVRSLL